MRAEVHAFLLAHDGTDPIASGFIYHFPTFGALMTCRGMMKVAIPAAFQLPPGYVADLNAQHPGLNLPMPVPIGDAWIVFKTAVMTSDYSLDPNFFV